MMKPFQKLRIEKLRNKGVTYAAIAADLGLNINTVKAYCRRRGVAVTEICPECKKELVHLPHKKKKRFCNDKCRIAWWTKNPDAVNRSEKASYQFICLHCKEPFSSYGNAKRKYCSRKCSGASRAALRGAVDEATKSE